MLAVGAGGPICFIPSSLKDERAKDNFASIARLICVAHAATAADNRTVEPMTKSRRRMVYISLSRAMRSANGGWV